MFSSDETDEVSLMDTSNTSNRLNRTVALHNIQSLCPVIAQYVIITDRQPAKLFIAGGKMILTEEGTTQGDPLAMRWHSICTVGIIRTTKTLTPTVHQVWLADDAHLLQEQFKNCMNGATYWLWKERSMGIL